MKRFWDKVDKTETCWLWTAWKNNNGYGALMVRHPGGGFLNNLAHRISWELEYGPIPKGLCVLHTCDTPSCVRPDHLFLGTRGDNARDKVAKGRARGGRLSGENHPRASITAEQAKQARYFYFAERRSAREIAEHLMISQHVVVDIARGRTWRST
jgi:hypothetical protein